MRFNKNMISLIGLIIILIIGIIILSNKGENISYKEIISKDSDKYYDIIVVDSNYLVLALITDNIVMSRLIMYDESDDIVWSNDYSYQAYDTYLTKITIYEDGYIAIGYFCDDEENTSSLIVKFDNNGNVLNESIFSYYNENYYTDILIDDDAIIVVGYSYDYDEYKYLGFVNIYDNTLITIDEEYINDIGLNAIKKNNDSYVLVGVSHILGEDKKGSLLIIDSDLTVVDSIIYEEQSEFRDIAVNDSGYFVVGTISNGNDNNCDALIVKYDVDGNFVWSNVLGGNNIDYYSKVITISNSNVLVVGTIYSSDIEANSNGVSRGVIVFYDSGGNIINNNYYGEGELYYSFNNIVEYDEDEYYILGIYDNSFGLIVKFSAN